jgi:uncharacterized protein (TIGR03435 family)
MRRQITCGLVLASVMLGQKPMEFEVASVRKAAAMNPGEIQGTRGGPGTQDPERINFRRTSFLLLLLRAFELDADRISGPGWLTTEYFDIAAKVPLGTTAKQFNVMLQNLLAGRFGLTYHYVKKDLTVYNLVISQGGLKIKESAIDPHPPLDLPLANPDDISRRRVAQDKDGFPELPPGNTRATLGIADRYGVTHFSARQTPISILVRTLQTGLAPGSRVVDKTGLTGKYDYRIYFMRQPNPALLGQAPPPGDINAAPTPDIFAAVQQQLGLRLEKSSVPFDVLVVDHIEKTPTEN